jgi:hypothetical protein
MQDFCLLNVSDDYRTVTPLNSTCLERVASGEKLSDRLGGRTQNVCFDRTEATEDDSRWWIWKIWRLRDGEGSAVYGLQFVRLIVDLSNFKPF